MESMQHRQRGVALVESAIAMLLTLTIIFGALGFTIIGYQQLVADMSAYIAARSYASALQEPNNSPHESTATKMLAQSGATAVAGEFGKPAVVFSFDSLYNSGIKSPRIANTTEYYASDSRVGGITLVAPQARQVKIVYGGLNILGLPFDVSVSGAAQEADLQVLNPDFNVAGSDTYTGTQIRYRYFGSGTDQHPFFFAHHYVQYCPNSKPWITDCGVPTIIINYGTAEHLDSSDIRNDTAGIEDNGNATAVFRSMSCHQRVLATIASALFSSINRPNFVLMSQSMQNQYLSEFRPDVGVPWVQYPVATAYEWDQSFLEADIKNGRLTVGASPVTDDSGCSDV